MSFLPSLSKLVRDEMEYVLMMRLCDSFFPAGPPAPGTVERRVDELLGKVRALRLQHVVEEVVQHALEKERWFDLASIDALAKYDIEISAPPDAYLQRFLTAMEYERNRFAGRVRDLALEKVLELPEKLKDSLKTGFLGLNLWEMDSLFTNAFFKVSQLLDQRNSLAQQTKNEWQRTKSEVESKVGLLKQISTDKGAKLKHGSETEARIRDVFKTLSVREILEKALAYTVAEGLAPRRRSSPACGKATTGFTASFPSFSRSAPRSWRTSPSEARPIPEAAGASPVRFQPGLSGAPARRRHRTKDRRDPEAGDGGRAR